MPPSPSPHTATAAAAAEMPPLPPLTLIVATTPTLGIGLRGALPWPPLKPDMAFFARVTKRLPPPTSPHAPGRPRRRLNAVLMGRKTWDSIPPKFRPLRGRVNVVVTRRGKELGGGIEAEGEEEGSPVVVVGGVEEGLSGLLAPAGGGGGDGEEGKGKGKGDKGGGGEGRDGEEWELGRVFAIGGAQIYERALRMRACERILWTRVEREWECDTWFPGGVLPSTSSLRSVDEEGGAGEAEEGAGRGGERGGGNGEGRGEGESGEERGKWVKRSRQELEQWCGEDVGGKRVEGGVGWEVEMWERVE